MSTIIVKRFNVHKQARDQIKTRIVYAPKQRVLNDLLDRDQNLQLPVVSVTIGGISRDNNRVFNKILGTYQHFNGEMKTQHERTPLPIDITFNVSIMTRYQQDMDQIISHIIPYINPYFTVSWRTPQRPDFEIRSNVFWNGDVSIQYPYDLTSTQVAKVVAEMSFVFKGWMFQAPQEPVNIVDSITTTHAAVNATTILDEFLLEDKDLEPKETFTYNASPPTIEVIEPVFGNTGKTQTYEVWGKGFEKINNVYLSGSMFNNISSYNPFGTFSYLSASYPAFSAVKLKTWTYDKTNYVLFVAPSAHSAGEFNVIIEGPISYGMLTMSSNVSSINIY